MINLYIQSAPPEDDWSIIYADKDYQQWVQACLEECAALAALSIWEDDGGSYDSE